MAWLALAGLLTACGSLAERQAGYGVYQPALPQQSATPDSPVMLAAHVARAQVLLTDLGYRPGSAHGLVGAETEEAIRAFQEYEGLSVDGRMSSALLAQLEVADRALSVRRAQVRLLALGYDPGPIDGNVGPRTRAAISVYEQDRGLPVRGEVTEKLLQSLRDEQPTPLPRSRLAAGEAVAEAMASEATASEATAPETMMRQTAQPGSAPAPEETASLAAIATAAGGTPAGSTAGGPAGGAGTAPAPVDLEAGVPADSRGALRSDDRMSPAPILPPEPEAGEPAQPPAPTVSLAALPDNAGRTGRPLAPGDRIRLAVGNEGADIIEREIGLDGQLALPGGLTVAAAGLTLPELKRAITVKLVESYLESLSVEVSRSGGAAGAGGTAEQQAPE